MIALRLVRPSNPAYVVACGFIPTSSGRTDERVGRSASVMTCRSRSAVRRRMPCNGQDQPSTPPASERVAQRPETVQGRGLAEDLHRLEERRRDARTRDSRAQRAEREARLDAETVDDRGAQRLLDAGGIPGASRAEHTGAVVVDVAEHLQG